MGTRSIHDNRIVGYDVDGERRRIVLHTESDRREAKERTDIVFEGVVAYLFENDNFGNILFGVEELPLEDFIAGNEQLFQTGVAFAWPGPWNLSPQASLSHMQAAHVRAFEISSSYGLSGWVVARSLSIQP